MPSGDWLMKFSRLLLYFIFISLMVGRFLQEQKSMLDTGSLLLGFLNFYGSIFDPRSTGMSVSNSCYFNRHVTNIILFVLFSFII